MRKTQKQRTRAQGKSFFSVRVCIGVLLCLLPCIPLFAQQGLGNTPSIIEFIRCRQEHRIAWLKGARDNAQAALDTAIRALGTAEQGGDDEDVDMPNKAVIVAQAALQAAKQEFSEEQHAENLFSRYVVLKPPSDPGDASATSAQQQKTKAPPAYPGAQIITIPSTTSQQKLDTCTKPHVIRGVWPQFQCSASILRRAVNEAEQGTTAMRMKHLSAQAVAAANGSPIEETCRADTRPPAGFNHAAMLHVLARYRAYLPRVTARLSADARAMAKEKRQLSQTCYMLLALEQERENLRGIALTSNASDKVKRGLINSLPDPKGLRKAEQALEGSAAKTNADLEAIGKANETLLQNPARTDAILSRLLRSKVGAHAGKTFGRGCHFGTKAK